MTKESEEHVVVIGYATLDYIMSVSENVRASGTSIIQDRLDDWPRAGGAALYASAQFPPSANARPITWIGVAEGGTHYINTCKRAGLRTDGVDKLEDGKTPTCLLAYQPDGKYSCLFDPGLRGKEALTSDQRRLIASASLVCIALSPPQVMEDVLNALDDQTMVAWIVKDDATLCPPDLRKKIAARADYIFFNIGEKKFVQSATQGQDLAATVLVETRGGQGVEIWAQGSTQHLPIEEIDTPDVTGAGDTFAGAMMGAIWNGEKDLLKAAQQGASAASHLLRGRHSLQKGR